MRSFLSFALRVRRRAISRVRSTRPISSQSPNLSRISSRLCKFSFLRTNIFNNPRAIGQLATKVAPRSARTCPANAERKDAGTDFCVQESHTAGPSPESLARSLPTFCVFLRQRFEGRRGRGLKSKMSSMQIVPTPSPGRYRVRPLPVGSCSQSYTIPPGEVTFARSRIVRIGT